MLTKSLPQGKHFEHMKLNEKAMLVKLSMSLPGNSRQDRKLSDEVKADKSLGTDAGRWVKTIYPKAAYAPLMECIGKVRTWHYEHSLAWQDDGWRILTSAMFMEYQSMMRQFKQEYDNAKEKFLADYDAHVAWAKVEQNGSFNPAEYPGEQKTREKFGFCVDFRPLPDAADFRVALQADEVAAIQDQIRDGTSMAIEQALKDLWLRLASPIRAMVEKLKGLDEKSRVHETIVTNIRDMVALIPALNLANDSVLSQFANEADNLVAGISAESLKVNKDLRSDISKKANDILSRMNGYFA